MPSNFFDNALAIGVESTYGTVAAETVFFKVVDGTFRAEVNDPLFPSAAGAAVGSSAQFGYDATVPRAFLGPLSVELSFEIEIEMDDIGFFLSSLTGIPAAPSTSDTTAKTHTFDAITTSEAEPSGLTVYWNDGVQDYSFLGFKVETLRIISGSGEGPLRAAISGPAQNWGTDAVTMSTMSAAPFAEFQNSNVRQDVVGTKPDSSDDLSDTTGENADAFEIVTTTPLRRIYGPGSRLIREPIRNGYQTSELVVPKDFNSTTYQAIMRNATVISRGRYWTVFLDTATLAGAATVRYSLEWDCPVGYLQGSFPTFPATDINKEELRIIAAFDGTNPHFQFNLINQTGTAYMT